jgi:hypothetical protein
MIGTQGSYRFADHYQNREDSERRQTEPRFNGVHQTLLLSELTAILMRRNAKLRNGGAQRSREG